MRNIQFDRDGDKIVTDGGVAEGRCVPVGMQRLETGELSTKFQEGCEVETI